VVVATAVIEAARAGNPSFSIAVRFPRANVTDAECGMVKDWVAFAETIIARQKHQSKMIAMRPHSPYLSTPC
jgi:hypothetical protein